MVERRIEMQDKLDRLENNQEQFKNDIELFKVQLETIRSDVSKVVEVIDWESVNTMGKAIRITAKIMTTTAKFILPIIAACTAVAAAWHAFRGNP